MKYFETYDGGIISLHSDFDDGDVFDIRKINGGIEFSSFACTTDIINKEDAIAALEEAIEWIKNGE